VLSYRDQGNTSKSITLVVFVNTSATRFPRLQSSTNTTRVTLAYCNALVAPSGSQSVFALTPPRAVWNGVDTVLDAVVSGYYFLYEMRHRTFCHLNMSLPYNRTAASQLYERISTPALFLDMCHLRCVFSATTAFSDTRSVGDIMSSGPMSGRLSVAVNDVTLNSDCAGTEPGYLTGPSDVCGQSTMTPRDGCHVHLVGTNASLRFTPGNGTVSTAFVATSSRFVVPLVTAVFCDEANNTILLHDTDTVVTAPLPPATVLGVCKPLLTHVGGTLGQDAFTMSYGVSCSNVSGLVNQSDDVCGNPNELQPLRFRVPSFNRTATGVMTTNSSAVEAYCVRNADINTSFVIQMEIMNEDAILPATDDQSTLPVPLQVRFLNWLGDPILRPLDPLHGTSNYPVRLDVLQHNTTIGATTVVQTMIFNVSLSQSPVVMNTVKINTPGVGFGLRLVGLSDAKPEVTLWGKAYPESKNITTHSCAPFVALFGLQYSTFALGSFTSCGVLNDTGSVLQDRMPLNSTIAGETTVTVFGWRFDYAFSGDTQCQYSTLSEPWSLGSQGSPAEWISSCEVRCTIPQQVHPIRRSSDSYVTPAGVVHPKTAPPVNVSAATISQLGTLRVKYGLLNSWSNALDLDVVGEAYKLDPGDSWAAVHSTFYSKEETHLSPPLHVSVVDVLGSPLLELDPLTRLVQVGADNSTAVDLNASKVVHASAMTCDPEHGVAIIPMVVASPSPGTYSLSLTSRGLQSGSANLFIVPYTNVTAFLLKARVEPYTFNTQTLENPLGTLPKQPVVIALNPVTRQLDTSVSDVSVIAIVTPQSPSTPVTTGVNLDETVCNPAFGNCAVFSNGVASFTKLSFVGVPGANYTLTIRLRNDSRAQDVQKLQFNITAAQCTNLPSSLDTMTAALIGPFNASLHGPASGFLVKGWKFDPAVGLACLFNGTELPATIVDYCTARCLLWANSTNAEQPPEDDIGGNSSNCRLSTDRMHVTCDLATGGPLYICNGTCNASTSRLTLVTGGNVTFVGRGKRITATPNVASLRCLSNGNQAVVAARQVRLDALIVSVVDSRGEFVSDVDPASDGILVTLLPNITNITNPLRVPYGYDGPFNDLANSTCFPAPGVDARYPAMGFSPNSTLSCRVQAGLCVFDQLFVDYPRVGAYELFAYSNQLEGNASFVLHMVSGRPNRLCIFTNLTGADSFVQHNYLLLHPPKLLALDVAGNVFQPGTLDPILSAVPYVTATQGTAPSANIKANLWAMVEDASANYSYLSQLPETAVLASDYTATFNTLTISNASYGSLFVPEFYVVGGDPPLAPVFAPPLRLLECTSGQFARWGGQSCETCLSGPSVCDGQQDFCFVCDGSSSLNVTIGYWRYSPKSYQAYVCPLGSCLGETELGTCVAGYLNHAPLCAVCDTGYAADFLGTCVRCSSLVVTAALFALACVAAIVIVAIIVFVTVTEQEDDDNSLVLLLKICVNFVQTSGTIGEFAMNVPSTVKQFLGFQNSVSGGGGISIAPFNCLAPSFTFMTKYRIQMVGPPVAALLVALVCKAITNRLNTNFRNLFNLVMMVFLFLVYQTLVSQSVSAMYCQPILGENGQLVMSLLRDDVRVSCLDNQYQYDFAIVLYSLAVYGLGIPVVALVVIMVTSARGGWEASYVRYSFLISGYRLRYWYWEIIIFSRKIGLLLLVAMTDNATLQALVGIWLLTASLVVTIRYQPFVKGVLNQAESLALLVQLVTVNVGLFFRTVSSSPTCGVLCIFVSCILLILNAGVFVYFGRHLLLEGYFRILGTFGLDVVHSDNRRYVSIRNIKKTILLQLSSSSRADFGLYTPSAYSAEITVSSPRKRKNMVSFVDDDDGSEQVELLTLSRVVTGDAQARRRSRVGNRHASVMRAPNEVDQNTDEPALPINSTQDDAAPQ
jgi:hypothetical protein